MNADTTFGNVLETFNIFAIVKDVTTTRATVVQAGSAAEVWEQYHDADDERLAIIGVFEAHEPGQRIPHRGAFISPDDMLIRLPPT